MPTEGPIDINAPNVLTMGRVSVDLYPEQIGVELPDVRTFRKMLGGTATNVAVAAARLGQRAGVITKVGDDPLGVYARRAMTAFGVDASRVGTHPSLRTPIVFCEIFPPDRFPLLFYREPTAPDMTLAETELDLEEIPPFAIGHGTFDPVISVEFSRQARKLLEEHDASVLYREYPLPHAIDPSYLAEIRGWLARVAAVA